MYITLSGFIFIVIQNVKVLLVIEVDGKKNIYKKYIDCANLELFFLKEYNVTKDYHMSSLEKQVLPLKNSF